MQQGKDKLEGKACPMRGSLVVLAGSLFAVVVLPMAGIFLDGMPLEVYLEFPPSTRQTSHAPFSLLAFIMAAVLIILGLFASARITFRCQQNVSKPSRAGGSFPWWGWCALGLNAFFWVLAWSRFDWAKGLQAHTFTPLWLSYIIFVNALCVKRDGVSLMTDRTIGFLSLFPASALFWWLFEYLNRFVQNWHYSEVEGLGPWEYFVRGSLCFSTVLPAVLSTQLLIYNSSFIRRCFINGKRICPANSKSVAVLALALSLPIMVSLGIFSNYLFPFLWVAPLAVLVSLQSIVGCRHILSGSCTGDWRNPVSAALAGLCCGWFWEMWNFFSLARWHYTIPFVEFLKVFEMPILGWAGYIPFGLECAAAAGLLGIWVEDLQVRFSS